MVSSLMCVGKGRFFIFSHTVHKLDQVSSISHLAPFDKTEDDKKTVLLGSQLAYHKCLPAPSPPPLLPPPRLLLAPPLPPPPPKKYFFFFFFFFFFFCLCFIFVVMFFFIFFFYFLLFFIFYFFLFFVIFFFFFICSFFLFFFIFLLNSHCANQVPTSMVYLPLRLAFSRAQISYGVKQNFVGEVWVSISANCHK